MKYTKEYLEENRSITNVLSLAGTPGQAAAAILGAATGLVSDTAKETINRPLQFTQAIGDAKRRTQIKRSKSTFGGGGEDSAKTAMLQVLGGDPTIDLIRAGKNRIAGAASGVVDAATNNAMLRRMGLRGR